MFSEQLKEKLIDNRVRGVNFAQANGRSRLAYIDSTRCNFALGTDGHTWNVELCDSEDDFAVLGAWTHIEANLVLWMFDEEGIDLCDSDRAWINEYRIPAEDEIVGGYLSSMEGQS